VYVYVAAIGIAPEQPRRRTPFDSYSPFSRFTRDSNVIK